MSNFAISDDDFRLLRDIIRERFGIFYDDQKQFLLLSRLQTRLSKRSLTNYADYVKFLRFGAEREAEFRDLASVLSNNETYFFRERAQVKALCGNILTELQAASPRLRPNRSARGRAGSRRWTASSRPTSVTRSSSCVGRRSAGLSAG